MRKHVSFALIMAVITMLGMASCEKKAETPSTSVPTTSQGAQKRLTGDEQIEKLNALGEQVLSQFKTQEQADLVRLTDYLTARFENTDWSAVMDSAGAGHVSYQGMTPMMATMRRISAYAYYSPMNFMDIVTLDNWSVSDFFGEFEFYESQNKWRFTGPNDNAAIFRCADQNGKEVVVTIKATGDTYQVIDTVKVYDYNSSNRIYTIDYWDEQQGKFIEGREIKKAYFETLLAHRDDDHEDENEFTSLYEGVRYYVHVSYPYKMQPVAAHLPSNLTVTLTDDGKEMINVALTFDIDRKDHIKLAGNVRLANIAQTYDLNVTRSAVRGNYEMKVNGNSICRLAIDNDGFNGLAIDPNNNLRTESDFNKYEKKAEDELKPGKTNMLLTILGGEMSIQGEMNGDAYYTGMKKVNETEMNYDGGKKRAEAIVDIWNTNILLSVYYGSNIKQAEIIMVVDDLEYNVAPAIYFIEDKVKMQFDQYFTRRSYGSLIDATEALINSYIDLFKEHKVEPIDL